MTTLQGGPHWQLPAIAVPYLERRLSNERQHGNQTLFRIRRVAEVLCQESNGAQSVPDCIKQLCPVIVEAINKNNKNNKSPELWASESTLCEDTFDTDVYVAAVITKTTALVERWLASGKEADQTSAIFGAAKNHAGSYGSHKLLAALISSQNYLDDRTFQVRPNRLHINRFMMLQQVARLGLLNATQFVFDFQTDEVPWMISIPGISRTAPMAYTDVLCLATVFSPDRAVFDFLKEQVKFHCECVSVAENYMTKALSACARWGWTDMADYCIELGAAVNYPCSKVTPKTYSQALLAACSHGQQAMVEMLLARGARPNSPALEYAIRNGHFAVTQMLLDHGVEPGKALSTATRKGYQTVVQQLLEHGAETKHQAGPILVDAIQHENEEMLELLLDKGGCPLNESAVTSLLCFKAARDNGSESMLQILEDRGIDVAQLAKERPGAWKMIMGR